MSGLFSSPKTPKVIAPQALPDETNIKKAKKRDISKRTAEAGRSNTFLSQNLGG